MKKGSILLITQVFYPDEVATASLLTMLCKELANKGLGVEVWAGQPSYTTREYQKKNKLYEGIVIKYLRTTNFSKKSDIGKIINYLTFHASVLFRLVFAPKVKVCTHTTPPVLAFFIALICKLKRLDFHFLVFDNISEGLVRKGRIKESRLFHKVWNLSKIKTLKLAKSNIVIGRDMLEMFGDRLPEYQSRFHYIPLFHDPNLIFPQPIDENEFVKQNKLEKKFIVQYSGNMGLWNDMQTFAKAIKMSEDPDVFFVFIGSGFRKESFIKEFGGTLPENLIMLPFQQKEVLNMMLNACHVSLISLDSKLEGIAVPSKIYGILASGHPTIALVPRKSEISYIINEEECGIQLNPGDAVGLLQQIQYLKETPDIREQMGRNARKAFLKRYTVGTAAERYYKLFTS